MNGTPKSVTFIREPKTRHQILPYEQKFAGLLKAVLESKTDPIQQLIIMEPSVIGDTYEEVIESLSQLAESKIALVVVRRDVPVANN